MARHVDSTLVYRISEETTEYIELVANQGQTVHRLYEDRDLQRNRSGPSEEFASIGSGYWLH